MAQMVVYALDGEKLLTNASEVLCSVGSGPTESIISCEFKMHLPNKELPNHDV